MQCNNYRSNGSRFPTCVCKMILLKNSGTQIPRTLSLDKIATCVLLAPLTLQGGISPTRCCRTLVLTTVAVDVRNVYVFASLVFSSAVAKRVAKILEGEGPPPKPFMIHLSSSFVRRELR